MINQFDNKCILVVGGSGFVGSNLILKLLKAKPKKIIIVDNLLSSNSSNIPKGKCIQFIYGSITDDKILFELPKNIDFVFHLSCYHGNQSSIADPLADHQNNTLTSLKLFHKLSNLKKIKKVVYAAAACAVAEKTYNKAMPTTEDQAISLYHDSPYSISKIIGELYGNYYFQKFKLPIVKARFSNVYGPREVLGAGSWRGTIHTIWRNVIPTFIWKALHNESLPLDNKGLSTRDFIFVDDLVKGLIYCSLKGNPGSVYNLATGNETSILDLAKMINLHTKNSTKLKLLPPREWDRSGKRFASTFKAFKELGFVAKTDINTGIKHTVKWTKRNYDLIKYSIEKHKNMANEK